MTYLDVDISQSVYASLHVIILQDCATTLLMHMKIRNVINLERSTSNLENCRLYSEREVNMQTYHDISFSDTKNLFERLHIHNTSNTNL